MGRAIVMKTGNRLCTEYKLKNAELLPAQTRKSSYVQSAWPIIYLKRIGKDTLPGLLVYKDPRFFDRREALSSIKERRSWKSAK